MSAASMAALIVANIKTLNTGITPAQEAQMIAYWTLICQGIIDEIVAAAVVEVNVVGGSSAGTHTGSVTS